MRKRGDGNLGSVIRPFIALLIVSAKSASFSKCAYLVPRPRSTSRRGPITLISCVRVAGGWKTSTTECLSLTSAL
jgi:hypothetical protein